MMITVKHFAFFSFRDEVSVINIIAILLVIDKLQVSIQLYGHFWLC